MAVSTSVRQIKVGRIVGLSAYELAIKNGSFFGTEQEFTDMLVKGNLDKINELSNKLNTEINRINETLGETTDLDAAINSINQSINALKTAVENINDRLPSNLTISVSENKDDVIFNINE